MSEWRSDAKPPAAPVDATEAFMAHVSELAGDEPICTVCDGEGCAACCAGLRPDVVDAIYERGRAAVLDETVPLTLGSGEQIHMTVREILAQRKGL